LVGPALTIPFLILPWLIFDRWGRFLITSMTGRSGWWMLMRILLSWSLIAATRRLRVCIDDRGARP
jgi:hypothetical protein